MIIVDVSRPTASGGPAAMFIGYLLSGTMIWAISHSIGEMAVM
jgi:amino acid transporter